MAELYNDFVGRSQGLYFETKIFGPGDISSGTSWTTLVNTQSDQRGIVNYLALSFDWSTQTAATSLSLNSLSEYKLYLRNSTGGTVYTRLNEFRGIAGPNNNRAFDTSTTFGGTSYGNCLDVIFTPENPLYLNSSYYLDLSGRFSEFTAGASCVISYIIYDDC